MHHASAARAAVVAALATTTVTAFVALARDAEPPSATGESGTIAIIHTLTLDGANRALAAAEGEARKRSAGAAIAVVDAGGHLMAFARLDGTFPAGADVSIGKARTAATFRKPTRTFEESIKDGREALLGVSALTPLQGGVPIEHDGFIVGAIGVSGAHSAAEDEQIALAGAAAVASPHP